MCASTTQRRALVTGGAGFIGSHLCELLLGAGWGVRVLDDLTSGSRANVAPGVEFVEGDVRSSRDALAACAGIDCVFHLAARVSIRHSVETFRDDADTNLMGTLTMLQAAGESGVRRFVHTSSMAVYSDAGEGLFVSESHPASPLSPYGISKLAGEHYVFMMGSRLGLEPVVLRLFNTYGTRQGYTPYVGVITIFVTNILAGKPCVIFGDGRQRRDFVHVADVAEAFRLAAESDAAPGQAFNVGSGRGATVSELADLLQSMLGRATFTHEPAQATELRNSVADISKARQLLGYRPRGTLEERLPEVIGYLKSRPA
ncbi:MAG TPA: NAD-dependent epimerase/dehydratase family protein [Candidatus Hydrogenedentes bacterium]|nr:NAD-dependent epimerase/dehydratase family protein [Candidatus Hydrogenedentota bacterium]HQH52631.1 NAD-dependent epimerase/dehydratase family protein [Candidatus Hydrogenedentota bacterium]HQM47090.1 NAD-dependent epimerase/dehydratase family protein [Candidatus Hydrogenedentota bacterium]